VEMQEGLIKKEIQHITAVLTVCAVYILVVIRRRKDITERKQRRKEIKLLRSWEKNASD